MDERTRSVVRVLLVCLGASTFGALAKIAYGLQTHTLSFFADGVHSVFDSSATIIGIFSVISASKPPDAEHPYGHQKFETIASLLLAFMLILAAYEVGGFAIRRFISPDQVPIYSPIGLVILFVTMFINLGIAYYEGKRAKALDSHFLLADSYHNRSDFLITCAVLVSLSSIRFKVEVIDIVVSIIIALYLVYLAIVLIRKTINPLVDHRVVDAKAVEAVASSIEGVLDCHAVRSRGHDGHYFLDLSIHVAGSITLNEAHEITHRVEDKLKEQFPGLADVVIHTEPHGHPPCSHNQ